MYSLLQSPLLFIPLSLALAFFMGKEQLKRTALFTILSAILSYGLKLLYNVGRVCGEGMECFTPLAFPSGHSAVAFAIALSFYPSWAFMPLFIYAIFVGISRILLGAHTFTEVMGGYALALLLFLLMSRGRRYEGGKNELLRQSSHIFVGLFFTLLYAMAKDLFLLTIFLGTALLLYYSAYIAGTVPFLRRIERLFERDAPFFGYGALHFTAGMLLLSLFVFDTQWAIAGMLILTLGDGLSTIVGTYLGRHPIPSLGGKTWEGTLTFLAISLSIALVLHLPLWVALLTTLAELLSKRLGLDDNLAICLSVVAAWWMAKVF